MMGESADPPQKCHTVTIKYSGLLGSPLPSLTVFSLYEENQASTETATKVYKILIYSV